jgi:N-acetyltransferase 10
MSVASSVAPTFLTKRKVDDRIKILIDDAVERKHRSIVLLVGDRGKDQIVNLHQMVSRANHSSKINLLWCMKHKPDFGSTSRKVQEKQARLEVKAGMSTETTKESFQTFLQQTQIRFCQYQESHKILGQTFGMAVLQDFEAITPNILARTIETVSGGGMIIVMLRAMRSLKQLYTIVMDVHARYRTESLRDVVPRFNERFLLSLADCNNVLCVDDDLHVLPFTSKMRSLGATKKEEQTAELLKQGRLQHEIDLSSLKSKLKGSEDVGALVQMCQTVDQAKTVLLLMQSIVGKTLNTTCAVTAGRGRGKSTALGIAVAGAVQQGYSNIFCTAPSPENVQTFFEFVIKGLLELGYKERVDFEAMQSTNPEFAKCVIRINIMKGHRQTVQFVSAQDSTLLRQAELLVIDEAAAIPLPIVKRMLGPYLIFLSSTISGYEGTGRSLSMKLVADMRKHSSGSSQSADGRLLKEISLSDPIRYGQKDPVEHWLGELLCLEATNLKVPVKSSPHPSSCELYYVSRDALFSYHPTAEKMLQNMMSLLVAAHYKNQPNDLQLMSDAPGHHLFVLCGPMTGNNSSELPDIFCVIHACEEGNVSSQSVTENLSRGSRPSGDLIPFTMAQYYLEEGFAKLAGLRVIRIATNPDFQRSGYGSRALQLLQDYYNGKISLTEAPKTEQKMNFAEFSTKQEVVTEETALVAPRAAIPALLTPIHERPYESLDYLGVTFGVTTELFNFWHKAGFDPLYVRQAANDTTGEHSTIMVHPFGFDMASLKAEFQGRFLSLLSHSFREMPIELALSIIMDLDVHVPQKLAAATSTSNGKTFVAGVPQLTWAELVEQFTVADLKRLKLCATAFVDTSVILDLVPRVARLYFEKRLLKTPSGQEGVILSHAQAALLLGVGLQCQTLEALSAGSSILANVPIQQLRAFFNKAMAKLVDHFKRLQEDAQETSRAESTDKKRTRDGEEELSEESGEAKGDEQVYEQYDAAGNVVGLTVAKNVGKKVDVDSTLRRDAKTSSFGAGGGSSDQSRSSGRMKMSKKTRGK